MYNSLTKETFGNVENLKLVLDQNMNIDQISIEMIRRNSITYLVPFDIEVENQSKFVRYNVTNLNYLSNYIQQTLKIEEIKNLFKSFIRAYEEIESYMLPCENLILDENFIFLNNDLEVCFLFHPYVEGNKYDAVQFLNTLISKIKPDYSEDTSIVFDIHNSFNSGAVKKISDLKELLRKKDSLKQNFNQENNGTGSQYYKEIHAENSGIGTSEETASAKNPLKFGMDIPLFNNNKKASVEEVKPIQKKDDNPVSEASQPVYHMGFEIPGMENKPLVNAKAESVNDEQKEKSNVKEKSAAKLFASFGSKLKKEDKKINVSSEKKDIKVDCNPPQKSTNSNKNMYEKYQPTQIINQNQLVREESESVTEMVNSNVSVELIRLNTQESYKLSEGITQLGSSAVAECRILGNPKISRRHLSIKIEDGNVFVTDNGSTNGTYINNTVLPANVSQKVDENSIIRIANEDFKIRFL